MSHQAEMTSASKSADQSEIWLDSRSTPVIRLTEAMHEDKIHMELLRKRSTPAIRRIYFPDVR